MKQFLLLMSISVLLFACAPVHHSNHRQGMPPGKAKKVYGTKSAKPFAPGQQKKNRY